MQPEVTPSRVPPTQQAPVFPSSQLNGCVKPPAGFPGIWGFCWGTGFSSPGWGTLGGGTRAGASGGASCGCGCVSDASRKVPSSKSDKARLNESSGPNCAIGLGRALDMMTVRSKKSFCIVEVGIDDMLATGKIF